MEEEWRERSGGRAVGGGDGDRQVCCEGGGEIDKEKAARKRGDGEEEMRA